MDAHCPAIDGQIAVAGGRPCTRESNGSRSTSRPALASDEVASIAGPGDLVIASSTVGVADLASVVSPEGVVVAAVCASLARCEGLAFDKIASRSSCEIGGSSKDG